MVELDEIYFCEHLNAGIRPISLMKDTNVKARKPRPGGSVHGERANFTRLILGCIRIRIRSRSVFEKKENLGVCAKQKVRLTRLGKYYVVQYYTLYRCAEKI